MHYPTNDDMEEIKRLKTLLSFNILDSPPEEEYDSLVKLISLICNSPIAIISMIDDRRQWYKAKTGVSQEEVPRAETFCRFTLEQDDILEIPDATLDERVKNNIHVTARDGIRFYAGVNVKASNGHVLGTVCVGDTIPRHLNEQQRQALRLIADQTMILLEARKKNRNLSEELEVIIRNKVKETKKQLLQKEKEYNLLRQAIEKSNGVVEFLPEGTIREVNENFLNLTGYSREEVLGKHHHIFLDEDQTGSTNDFWSSLQKGKFYSGRLKRKHKNGSSVWIQATYNPISFQQKKVSRVIKIAQDITLEIEAEKSLERSKVLAEALNIQKDNFIANISHEIRTPIHAILGFTQLLLEQEKDANKKSYLGSVKTAGDNLLYIINDILDLSKIEAGSIHLEKEPFDLLQLVQNVFSILHLKAHQKKISFKYIIDPEVDLHLVGDKNRLTQILINLLGNALKFTSSGSVELYVDLLNRDESSSSLQFRIVDTGIGIPSEKVDLIFDRFSQAEEDTSRKYGGTGLGLNISRQLIEKQGGSIQVKSKEGEGSVFSFQLSFGISDRGQAPEVIEKKALFGSFRKANILLCEDNELNQKLINAILTEGNFSIDLADNGEKGIGLLKHKTYDLILMDIQMPHMNGYEATHIIREELKLTVPIVALTANFMLSEKLKCSKLGMNDYLSKPFSREELLEKVAVYLTETREVPDEKISEEDINPEFLSLSTLEELCGGNKEFQIEIINLFMQQVEKMYTELKELMGSNDRATIRSTAHKMKASFGIIGADISLLDELEHSQDGIDVSPKTAENIDALGRQLQQIYQVLNNTLEMQQHGSAS